MMTIKSTLPMDVKVKLREEVLTEEHPLGPSFFEFSYGSQDNELYQYLFDGHSRYLYESSGERPSIIVGRKGAGKSTYLNNLSNKKDVIAIVINSWDVLDEVQSIVRRLCENGHDVRAEKCSYIWNAFFLTLVALETYDELAGDSTVKSFLAKLPWKQFGKLGLSAVSDYVSGKIDSILSGASAGRNIQFSNMSWIVSDITGTQDSMKELMSDTLKSMGKTAIILFDNEEDVFSHKRNVLGESHQTYKKIAVSGLLNLCGRFNLGASNVQLRYNIPAEQYYSFYGESVAPGKDFRKTHLLHWTSAELLSITAHRYLLFLDVWKDEVDLDEGKYEDLLSIDIYTRDGALHFFRMILPETIDNDRGLKEDSVAYILRHFQLLPRQIIDIFNKIILASLNGDRKVIEISQGNVKYAVNSQEEFIASEIIKAYENKFPEADEMWGKLLPNMPVIISYRSLMELYDSKELNNNGKAVLSKYRKNGVEVSPDRFYRCLVETGMVGRVVKGPGHHVGYVNAEFEYTLPGTLNYSEDALFAIHPVFSGQHLMQAKHKLSKNVLGVYPSGADPVKDFYEDREKIARRYKGEVKVRN